MQQEGLGDQEDADSDIEAKSRYDGIYDSEDDDSSDDDQEDNIERA